ncbi:MAG: cell division protein ZapA [Rickettsiales bacterium]|jgi:cell division protein ZapA (FtsZ GTPase activity inhibitor)|nr:cell division protein ZapA [Rickettsiales bacterium]
MATLDFTINAKPYSVDVPIGQEAPIRALVSQIDAKAREFAAAFGDVDSETLLLMVAIYSMMDLNRMKARLPELEKTAADNAAAEAAIASIARKLANTNAKMNELMEGKT